ncbi:MAG: glycosyltransferase family 2 protein [Spirochaetales bacterium]|nr:glycosyltransferase family 2 protein [Spirochaetales bacterium]
MNWRPPLLIDPARLAIVIPSFRVRETLPEVVRSLCGAGHIYVVDDCCPDASGQELLSRLSQAERRHVQILRNEKNMGVGGAVKAGYARALADCREIIVKIDGDGQMDVSLLPQLVEPVARRTADYVKGNRFGDVSVILRMPPVRLGGNFALSFLSKFSHGYWSIMDPTNGYTAISARMLALLPLSEIADDYFFECDMLFALGMQKARVLDIPMPARYGNEVSSMDLSQVLLSFPPRLWQRFWRRQKSVLYNK